MIEGAAELQAGWEHHARGRWDEAERLYRGVIAHWPDHADAWCLLGALDLMRGRPAEAVASFRESIRSKPGYAQAHNNLGVALSESGQVEASEASYREAIRLQPDYAEAHNNLGSTLRDLLRHEEAVRSFHHATELRPDYAEAWNNLGVALTEAGSLAEATDGLRRAVTLKPDYAEAWLNLGNVLRDRGDLRGGAEAYDRAVLLRPDYPEARYNRSLLLLQAGDESRGWAEFEARWQCRQFAGFQLSSPVWDGSPLGGRTVLLVAEQGLGDTIQFVRFARLVGERGGRAILAAPEPLLALLARTPGLDQVVPTGTVIPPHDCHLPLMSLPRLLGGADRESGAGRPYVFADPAQVQRWRERLSAVPGRRIGIAWQGNPRFRADRRRSIPLAAFEPLAQVAEVALVGLQKGFGAEQLRALGDRFAVHDLGPEFAAGDLDDAAAVLLSLEQLITSDSALAHLAGAMGVPVWLAHGAFQEWRWTDEAAARWYPSLRVFRQPEPGRWDLVMEAMAAALAAKGSGSIAIAISPGELIDRLTILEIKQERIGDPAKLANIRAEYESLDAIRRRDVPVTAQLDRWTAELMATNLAIWEVEEIVRRCERRADFGPEFVAAARTVYHENDRRAVLKRAINERLGSPLVEEKSHALTSPGHSPAST